MKLSVIMPVYNERATIAEIVRRVRAVPLEKEILIIDDASTDGTRDWLLTCNEPDVRVFLQPLNRGKGAAVRTGLQQAIGDIAVIQDADLEYDPADFPHLVAPIVAGEAQVVYGSRFLARGRRATAFWHFAGNRLLTALSNLFTGQRLTDMETCYKAVRMDLLRRIELDSDGFDIEPELTAKISRLGVEIREVPISYDSRGYGEGKKIGWRDGLRTVRAILRYGLGRNR
ncbi:MAG: glycosyltransferase [Candidatus Eisenbacteria bacterium]|nr:glycosyltransferase [Candidatus Eisenbacteria bacterium]